MIVAADRFGEQGHLYDCWKSATLPTAAETLPCAALCPAEAPRTLPRKLSEVADLSPEKPHGSLIPGAVLFCLILFADGNLGGEGRGEPLLSERGLLGCLRACEKTLRSCSIPRAWRLGPEVL